MARTPVAVAPVLLAVALSACSKANLNDPIIPETQGLSHVKSVAHTYHTDGGNRFVQGKGNLTSLTPVDIPLPASATWIAAVPNGLGSIWTAVLADGVVKAYKVQGQSYEEVSITPSKLAMPVPPTLVVGEDGSVKLGNVFAGASPYSAAVIVDKSTGDRAFVANNGDVVLMTSSGEQHLAVNALPYARILLDENKRLLVLTGPTARYDHLFVLGSQFNHASAITLIQTQPTFSVLKTISVTAPDVIEGNALIWEDTNGDNQREIITTLARSGDGARIVVYNEDGTERSSSAAIGFDHRWRHQIAVAPFQSPTQTSLVSTYVPHIGPNIEYFRLDDSSMTRRSLAVDYSSHLYTTLNLDMGITGDFDNDDRVELLLVNRNTQKQLGAFEYKDNSIALKWTLPLTDTISSNVAAATLSNNSIAFGVGQGKTLRIWHP